MKLLKCLCYSFDLNEHRLAHTQHTTAINSWSKTYLSNFINLISPTQSAACVQCLVFNRVLQLWLWLFRRKETSDSFQSDSVRFYGHKKKIPMCFVILCTVFYGEFEIIHFVSQIRNVCTKTCAITLETSFHFAVECAHVCASCIR